MMKRLNASLLLAATALSMPVAAVAQSTAAAPQPTAATNAPAQDFRARTPEQEVVYFVLPDRFENGDPKNDKGGFKGDRLKHGFDPSAKGYFHGGDLKGLTQKLDYIQGMGATAIWFAPIFKNKPVQGPKGDESAGYHGYWVTDFTQVDPHFGTNAEFKAFVDAAHARGMKVYMDIITNHTADVIRYREGDTFDYAYRGLADYPFSRSGGVTGKAINEGFAGDHDGSAANWAKLTNPAFAYTPYVPKGEEKVKVPAWLNDPIYYHNRGNSEWVGESALYGDFVGLDDLATEHPRVVQGFIDIYGKWVDDFGIDGFRIDTAKHVNPEFWQAFVPAILSKAKAKGIPNFHIFGEVATQDIDPALLARWTRKAHLPSVLDMAFATAAQDVAGGKSGTDVMANLLENDALFDGDSANRLPTFIGNHDFGRGSMFIKQHNPGINQDDLLARTKLAHAMMLTLRGVPVIYYGDEQGFVSDGNDQLAREDMMPSKVALYNDNQLIGTTKTTADANFDTNHPLYRLIRELSDVRRSTPALMYGKSAVRAFSDKPGILAVSRFDPRTGAEVLVAFNTSGQPIKQKIRTNPATAGLKQLSGNCPAAALAPGSVEVSLPAFGYAVCAAVSE